MDRPGDPDHTCAYALVQMSAMFSEDPRRRASSRRDLGSGGAAGGTPRQPTPVDDDSSFEDADARLALDLLRALADQEFARADRFGSRARNAFALTAGFFAVSQAVAFGSFVSDRITSAELTALLVIAALAAMTLAAAGWLVLQVERVQTGKNLEPDQVVEVLNTEGGLPGQVVDRFVELYAAFVKDMRRLNKIRLDDAVWVRRAAAATIVLTLAELLYAFWVRR